MPNTTNYSFPTPADSDLVKNGADAIRDLGDAVDTAMNTALGTKKAGMVLLNTTSFSGVASQAITPVFSATYQNYKIILTFTANSLSANTRIRLRAGATNAAGNNYARAGYYNYSSGSAGNLAQSGVASIDIGNQSSAAAGRNVYLFDFANPFLAKETTVNMGWAVQDTAGFIWASISFLHDLATSYDGFDIIADSGTISGKVSVYGYNL